jgi:acyl-CoA synthetase (AMP-forming)/AMP-acid ligase II
VANNLADKFEAMADAAPGRMCVIDRDQRLTYADVEALANRFAHHLADHGIGPGDAVALASRNSAPWIVAFLAALKLRAVPVNVNYRYVAGELAHLFDDSGSVAIVVDADLVDECAFALAGRPPRHVVVIGDGTGLLAGITFAEAASGQSANRDFPARSPDDITLLYTGGTTGLPKGVVWRQEDTYLLVTSGHGSDAAVDAAGVDPDGSAPVIMPCGPFVHSSSQWMLLGALLNGCTTVALDRFDPHRVWDVCEQEGVTFLGITGDAMAGPLVEVLGAGRKAPESVMAVSSSGGALSAPMKAALTSALPHVAVFDTIGATETGLLGTAAVRAGEAAPAQLRVQGTPDTIVVDESGQAVPPGTDGRLAKGGIIPLRYHNDPEKTARTFITHNGRRYAIPGDAARLEPDGSITVLGRQSSCINTGGEKVYPNEVESVLKSHPAVEDCLVVGVPDLRWGQQVCALVKPRGSAQPTLDDLQRHARAALAAYKIPRALCLVQEVQRLASGKPDYRWAAKTTEDALLERDRLRPRRHAR